MLSRSAFPTMAIGCAIGFGIAALVAVALGSGGWKVTGPFGFGVISALLVGGVSIAAPIYARWLVATLGFFVAAWLGSFGRQAAFEFATAQHLTTIADACTGALLPFVFVALVVPAAIVATAPLLALRLRGAPVVWSETERERVFPRRTWRITVVLAIALGATLGISHWSDWQVNSPCL